MSRRDVFLEAMRGLVGKPVLWAQKGPDAFDCSGSVTWCLKQAGGPDLLHTHNAQALHDATRLLGSNGVNESPLPGDLVFYGVPEIDKATGAVITPGWKRIEHVAVYEVDGGIISADGATSHVTSLAVALANPANRVRRHNTIRYRSDTPYIAVHRNTLVDVLDGVTR